MKDYVNIEGCSVLLLIQLEGAIESGTNLPAAIVLAMNDLKKALDASDRQLTKDLEKLSKQINRGSASESES